MKNFLKWFVIAILIISQLPLTYTSAEEISGQRIIYVDINSTEENPDGLTWETAFKDLYAAIDAANDGDQIWVAEGKYSTSGKNDFIRISKEVSVYGGFKNGDTSIEDRDHVNNLTILSGDTNGDDDGTRGLKTDNAGMVVNISNGNVVLDGFTIQDGYFDKGTNTGIGSGAGIYISGTNNNSSMPVILSNLNIKNNEMYAPNPNAFNSLYGVGIYAKNSNLNVSNVKVYNNSIQSTGTRGSVYLEGGTFNFNNVEIYDNTHTAYGTAMGIGLEINLGTLNLTDSKIYDNNSLGGKVNGSGLYVGQQATVTVEDTEIFNNNINFNSLTQNEYLGGGIYNWGTTKLINVIVEGNRAIKGGGIYNHYDGTLTITNSTINENELLEHASTISEGAGIYSKGTLTVRNSDITSNKISTNRDGYGAGINIDNNQNHYQKEAVVENSKINGNQIFASNSVSIYRGAGININDGNLKLENVELQQNEIIDSENRLFNGDVIFNYIGRFSIYNTTLVGNTSTNRTIESYGTSTHIYNSIFYNVNTGYNLYLESSYLKNDYESGLKGSNFDDLYDTDLRPEEIFVDYANGDLRLVGSSPLVNRGNNDYNYNLNSKLDLQGLPRVQGSTIDLGAYEFNPVLYEVGLDLPGTVNEDEIVDTVTVLAAENRWNITNPDSTKMFAGWNTQQDGLGTYYPVGEQINIGNGNLKLYPEWGHKVTIVRNDGTVDKELGIKDGEVLDLSTYETRDHYTFVDWYTDSEFNNSWNPTTAIISSITLYAKWNPIMYDITFDTGQNASPISSTQVQSGQALTKPTDPTKPGHTLVGWFTDADLTIPYNFSTLINNELHLYAKWSINSYNVNYYVKDTDEPASAFEYITGIRKVYNTKLDSNINITKEGFSVKRWYTDEGLSNEWNFASDKVEADTNLYGEWDRGSFTVTFNNNGRSFTQTVPYNEYLSEPIVQDRTGYTFNGWYTSNNTKWSFDQDKVKGLMTLTAKWDANEYDITFYRGNAVIGTSKELYDSLINGAPTTALEGYAFYGWYKNQSFSSSWNLSSDLVSGPQSLYGRWIINTYTVTFNDGAGTASQWIQHNGKVAVPTVPTKAGHTFVGWYKDADKTVAWNFDTDVVTENTTIYAKWTINSYTVTFEDDGAGTESQTIEYNQKATEPTAPTKLGHTFGGWYKNETKTVPWNFGTDVVTGNVTIYAKWIANEYTVTFEDGEGTPTQTIEYNEKVTEPTAPTKPGYTFGGWYKDADTTEAWDFDTDVVTKDVTIYAKWTINSYTVTFADGEGTGSQTIEYNEKATEPTAPTKPGYTFAGWYKNSDKKVAWNFGTDKVTGNVTIYAKWTINSYTVTYEDGEGTPTQTIEHDKTATEPTEPTKLGYTFGGWYKDADKTVAWNFGTDKVTGNVTIYAKWTAIGYTVTFEDGEGTSTQTIEYNNLVIEPTAPTKAGYTFGGWYKDAEKTVAWNFGTDKVTGNVTIYAKWTINSYTVTFEDGAGTLPQTIEHDKTATEPTEPTKPGYTFGGWYKGADHTVEWDFDTDVVTENTTIYAKWTINSYTVTFEDDGAGTTPQTIEYDKTVTEPTAPTKPGYTFGGWFKDAEKTVAWNFGTDKITANLTIYAKWIKIPDAPTNVEVTRGDLQVTVSFDTQKVADSYKVIVFKNGVEDAALSKVGQDSPIVINSLSYGIAYTFQVIALNEEVASERSAVSESITFTAPVTPPSGGGGGGVPSTPSTPTEEEINLPIINDGSAQTLEAIVKRIRNGQATTDEIALTNALIQQALASLQAGNNNSPVIGLSIGNQPAGTLTQFKVEAIAAKALADYLASLQLGTDAGAVIIPSVSLQSDGDITFEFNAAVLQQNIETIIQEILAQTTGGTEVNSSAINVIGTPVSIKTNLQNTPVTVRLPIPASLSEEERKKIMVYIDHSNGERELKKGRIVQLASGAFVFEVDVNHFSTFALVTVDGLANEMKPGYIKGYANGGFGPNDVVTRGELATMLARFVTEGAIPKANTTYTDTANHFAKDAIEFVREAGLFKGVTEVLFKPADQMTRAEVAAVAMRWIQLQCENDEEYKYCVVAQVITPYTDVDSTHWAYTAIQAISARGIMVGKGADNFDPNGIITRAEAVKVLNRLFGYEPMQNVTASSFNDVAPTHWAIGEIEAAAKGFTGK